MQSKRLLCLSILILVLFAFVSCKSSPVTYTITYDTNTSHNGSGAVLSKTTEKVSDGATITLPTASTRPTGYHLIGFSTDSEASTPDYDTDSPVKSDMTLYALWSDRSTITYKTGSATGGAVPENQVKTDNTPLTLASGTGKLTKDGSMFLCWNTKEDGKGTDYREGGSLTQEGDLTLYPRWCVTYVVGEAGYHARIWKNGGAAANGGKTLSLSSSTEYSSEAFDIAVLDDDVYVAGSDASHATWKATLWKNGGSLNNGVTITLPTTGDGESHAKELEVSGNDIYVCGSEVIDTHEWTTIWKNGNLMAQKELSLNSISNGSLAVCDGNVSIIGVQTDSSSIPNTNTNTFIVAEYNESSKVWKTTELISNEQNPLLWYSLGSSGETVTIYAIVDASLVQWKKTTSESTWVKTTLLTNDILSSADGIYAIDSGVIVTYNDNGTTVGALKILRDGSEETFSYQTNGYGIAFSNGILTNGGVYLTGYQNGTGGMTIAKIWKQDGEAISLTDGTTSATAYAMAVIAQ